MSQESDKAFEDLVFLLGEDPTCDAPRRVAEAYRALVLAEIADAMRPVPFAPPNPGQAKALDLTPEQLSSLRAMVEAGTIVGVTSADAMRAKEPERDKGPECTTCQGHRFVCDSFDMPGGPCSNHPEQQHPNRRPCPNCTPPAPAKAEGDESARMIRLLVDRDTEIASLRQLLVWARPVVSFVASSHSLGERADLLRLIDAALGKDGGT